MPSGIIIQKVVEYLQFKVQYADWPATDVREDFQERIDPYIALELYVLSFIKPSAAVLTSQVDCC